MTWSIGALEWGLPVNDIVNPFFVKKSELKDDLMLEFS